MQLIFHSFPSFGNALHFAEYIHKSFELKASVYRSLPIGEEPIVIKDPLVIVERPGEEDDRPDDDDDDPIIGENQEVIDLIVDQAKRVGGIFLENEED